LTETERKVVEILTPRISPQSTFKARTFDMPSDDSILAIQALNESDERQRSPIHRFAQSFLEIVKLFSPPGSELTLGGISAVFGWLDKRSSDNLAELVTVLADELRHRGAQIQRLMQETEEHRKFVADDLPGLVLDALRRAEGVRAKDRIKRLATVLVHAAEVGRRDLADYAEEMLRIATELSEPDVVALREIVEVQARLIRKDLGRVTPRVAHDWMPQILASLKGTGFLQGEIDSICAKLESFGLVTKTERNVNLISDNPTPYALLQKGADFIAYIRSESQNSA